MEQRVEHGAIGHPLGIGDRVAVEAVLAHVEEEGGQVFVAEIGQRTDICVEVEALDRIAQRGVHLRQQGKDIAFQFGHRLDRHPLGLAEPVERAQQVAEGVAQLAVLVGHALEDLVADPVVLGEIDGERPQPDDIRAIGFHHLVGIDRVTEALGHLHALRIHREAVGQDPVIGRAAAGGAAFEQARLEPAAMLVRAFDIDVGRPAEVRPAIRFQHIGMARARIEPDVEDVGHRIPLGMIVLVTQEAVRGIRRPGVDPLLAHGGHDCRVDLRIDQVFAALAIDEQRDRHAPGALAAEHPVRAARDHAADPVAALVGGELDAFDFGEGNFAQGSPPPACGRG